MSPRADVQSEYTHTFVIRQLKVCKAIRQLSSWRSLAQINWMSFPKNTKNKAQTNKNPKTRIKCQTIGNSLRPLWQSTPYRNQMLHSTLNCNAGGSGGWGGWGWSSAVSGTPTAQSQRGTIVLARLKKSPLCLLPRCRCRGDESGGYNQRHAWGVLWQEPPSVRVFARPENTGQNLIDF